MRMFNTCATGKGNALWKPEKNTTHRGTPLWGARGREAESITARGGTGTRYSGLLRVLIVLFVTFFSVHSHAADLVKPGLKQGYYFTLTPVGEMVFVDSEKNYGPWPSAGGHLRMGEALNRWIDLGIAGGFSYAKGDNLRLLHGHFGMDATFKPTRFLSLGLQAGMGFADFTRLKNRMEAVIGRFGATYGFTVAYDFFPGSRKNPYQSGGLALTPVAGVYLGPGTTTSVYSMFVGLSVSWWTGLPKNRLDLPVDQAF